MYQLVPSDHTGRALAPPPTAVLPKLVVEASVTKALAPAPTVAADGKFATVVPLVRIVPALLDHAEYPLTVPPPVMVPAVLPGRRVARVPSIVEMQSQNRKHSAIQLPHRY